jgi:hypothetical protein
MMTPPLPETGPVLLVECPLCDCPASVNASLTSLACASCGVRADIADAADDPAAPVLAAAA